MLFILNIFLFIVVVMSSCSLVTFYVLFCSCSVKHSGLCDCMKGAIWNQFDLKTQVGDICTVLEDTENHWSSFLQSFNAIWCVHYNSCGALHSWPPVSVSHSPALSSAPWGNVMVRLLIKCWVNFIWDLCLLIFFYNWKVLVEKLWITNTSTNSSAAINVNDKVNL